MASWWWRCSPPLVGTPSPPGEGKSFKLISFDQLTCFPFPHATTHWVPVQLLDIEEPGGHISVLWPSLVVTRLPSSLFIPLLLVPSSLSSGCLWSIISSTVEELSGFVVSSIANPEPCSVVSSIAKVVDTSAKVVSSTEGEVATIVVSSTVGEVTTSVVSSSVEGLPLLFWLHLLSLQFWVLPPTEPFWDLPFPPPLF